MSQSEILFLHHQKRAVSHFYICIFHYAIFSKYIDMKGYMKTIRETAFETNPDKSPEIPGFEIEKHYYVMLLRKR